MNKVALLVCALDTKGEEARFVRALLEAEGIAVKVMDTGVLGEPAFTPDISAAEVALAGGMPLGQLALCRDRGEAVATMMRGAAALALAHYKSGQAAGVIALGGSAGTSVGTAAMRALPLGAPKLMVTTLASGNTRPYVGMHDITMVHSVVDVSGLNRILRPILANAARAFAGMVGRGGRAYERERPAAGHAGEPDKPMIAASMFGVTTACVETAKTHLERNGYEVLVFHGTGIGGATMEKLIAEGFFAGVLDVTTSELADDAAGGLLSAGEDRLTKAGLHGIPQVVSVGAVDMANFGPPETVPPELRSRQLLGHNPNVTLMRTNVEENRTIGHLIANKLNLNPDRTALFLPGRGVSSLDAPGQPFYGPDERAALFGAIRERIHPSVRVIEKDAHINDERFALAMAQALLELIAEANEDNK